MTQQATNLSPEAAAGQASQRPGRRFGTVAELTVIAPLKPGGAAELRAKFQSNDGRYVKAADTVGTLHDERYVIFDNDTRLLFCTAYDGDWDAYIDDFATKIPEIMDEIFSVLEGWPGIRSPQIKDWIVQHQITATGWYCAYPNASVKQVLKGQKVLQAFDNLLDIAAS
jgi:hypothetical protein